jgi:hypothetical protein
LTIKTPDLQNPCEPSDNLLQFFKWLPSDSAQETKLPPLRGQLCFVTEEVEKIANSDPLKKEGEIESKFFKVLGVEDCTATPYKAQTGRDFFQIRETLERGIATPCMRLHMQPWFH